MNDDGAGVPDVRHPKNVKWRPDRIPAVRHPEKGMAAGQKSPSGGMSYAARSKRDRLHASERELHGIFLGRIP